MKHSKNKRMKRAWSYYCNSSDTTLNDVYGSYSSKKEDAYKECVEYKVSVDGEDLRICSHSRDFFTVGFRFRSEGKRAFCFISPTQKTWAYIEELEEV